MNDRKAYDAAAIIDDTRRIEAQRHKSNFVIFSRLKGYAAGGRALTTALIDSGFADRMNKSLFGKICILSKLLLPLPIKSIM